MISHRFRSCIGSSTFTCAAPWIASPVPLRISSTRSHWRLRYRTSSADTWRSGLCRLLVRVLGCDYSSCLAFLCLSGATSRGSECSLASQHLSTCATPARALRQTTRLPACLSWQAPRAGSYLCTNSSTCYSSGTASRSCTLYSTSGDNATQTMVARWRDAGESPGTLRATIRPRAVQLRGRPWLPSLATSEEWWRIAKPSAAGDHPQMPRAIPGRHRKDTAPCCKRLGARERVALRGAARSTIATVELTVRRAIAVECTLLFGATRRLWQLRRAFRIRVPTIIGSRCSDLVRCARTPLLARSRVFCVAACCAVWALLRCIASFPWN